MSVIFLTSDIGASKKINGERIVTKLNNVNHFIENLEKYIKSTRNFVYVASDSNSYNSNDSYANITFNSFKMSGLEFKNLVILDNRTIEKADGILQSADLIYLAGGDTRKQMKFFKDIKLRKKLINLNKLIIGQSAGALNLSDEVYCSPDNIGELNEERYFEGLGLTQINIEPHYKTPTAMAWKDLQNILLEDSKRRPFIALTDGSYIVDNDENYEIYGEAYKFEDGKCHQVCQNGQSLKLKKILSVERMVIKG